MSSVGEDLSNTLCTALKALIRSEVELLRRDQAEAAARHEDKLNSLLQMHETRMRMVLAHAGRALPNAGASQSPKGDATPVRRSASRRTSHQADSSPAGSRVRHSSEDQRSSLSPERPSRTPQLP